MRIPVMASASNLIDEYGYFNIRTANLQYKIFSILNVAKKNPLIVEGAW